ncbi:MAG: LPP20 family lipoprotein, partial [Treponema sp.]|nr:LPP20 family lipoprotein [Treponema sp.]
MAVLLLVACASVQAAGNNQTADNSQAVQNAAQQEAAAALTAAQLAQRPPWILQPPESAEYLYFTGMAEADGESEARNAAVRNGFAAAASFYGNLIQSETIDHSIFMEDMRRTIAEATTYNDKTNSYTNAVVSDVRVIEYYTETYRASNTRLRYKVWALCRISRQKAEEDRANFAEDISGRYAHLLDTPYDTMSAALLSYSAVLSALEQNPLHRAVAYYDGPGGRVGLYDYCGVRLHAIAGNAGFDSLPAAAVRRGRPFTGTIRLSAGTFSEIGAVPCRVVITGKNNNTLPAEYPLEKNNSFALQIPTARLEAGTYTVQLELLLNAAAPALRQNPKGAFTLEVRPASAEIRFGGDTLSGTEQRMLSQAVQEALQTYQVPLLDGYDFLVTFSTRTRTEQITGVNMLLCDVSISLNSGGSVLYQSSPEHFPEIDRDQALKKASDYIR